MCPQNGAVPGQVIKVVHDDGHKEIEHEEGAEEDECDEVGVGEGGTAHFGLVLAGRLVEGEGPGVARTTLLTGKHDARPRLTRGTSVFPEKRGAYV